MTTGGEAPRCWRESFRVRFADLDAGGLASAAAWCRWLQEAAGGHARAAGLAGDDLLWVLAELRLRVDRYPVERDRVEVATWAAARLGGARGYRDFSLGDQAGRTIGAAATMWLLLDPTTRRPMRLPSSVLALREPGRDAVVLPEATLPAAPALDAPSHPCTARWHDLDPNGHVTNTRLVEWLLDAVPDEAWRRWRPCRLSVRFAGEVRSGETVLARGIWDSGSGSSRHALAGGDGTTRAVATASWLPLSEAGAR
jgi:acyl-ACP thioesterase